MTGRALKVRAGGLRELEDRVVAGETRALRALVRQAMAPNTLDLPQQRVEAVAPIELRSAPNGTGGERLTFTGYASVVESPYEMADWLGPYTEVVRESAFTSTLAQSPDVVFVINHDWRAVPMARTGPGTLNLAADSTGLLTEARIDPSRADVNTLRSAIDGGEVTAMSFAFYVVRQMWSPDFMQRDILEVDLDGGDTSPVTWPANPATDGTVDLRKRQARALLRTRVPRLVVERARAEKREDKTLSAATVETLSEVLDLIASADEGLDAAQPLLAELLGVPDPDADEPTGASDDTEGGETGGETKSAGRSLALVRALEDARS